MDIISRKDALKWKIKYYYTGKKCRNNHLTYRYTNNGTCILCSKDTFNRWIHIKREYFNEYQRMYNGYNIRLIKQYLNDPDEILFEKRSRQRKHLIIATRKWADKQQIRNIYDQCVKLTEKMNIIFEVDHIIPLKGKNVCGLHVETNLRIVSRTLNKKKGNKFEGLKNLYD